MSRARRRLHASGASCTHAFIPLLLLLLCVLQSCRASGPPQPGPERFPLDVPQYEVVHPTRVDARGHFLSNFLSHHARRVRRREASEGPADLDRVFYRLWHDSHSLHLNLSLNPHLLAPGFLTERRYGGLEGAQIRPRRFSRCHFLGEVWDEASVRGSAAISACDGLTGFFRLSDEEYFIQPLEKWSPETSAPQAHAIYKRHVSLPSQSPVTQPISGKQAPSGSCGVTNSHQSLEASERQREHWERRQHKRRRRIRQRSVSREKWVETLVVADPKMVEYHGSQAVESYILAVMNIVAGLFRDASIGNAINIVVVRLILLEQDEDDLKITHHADNSLNSFCKWQKKLNMKGDEHPLHHDVSVLLTRKDICAAINMPCETLGLSHVAGMCQPHRSCSINEDTGLPLAFTVAHELGHNFGIQHDGNGNDCEPIGKRPFVMSSQLLYGTSLPRWSRCSRQYITRFLDRGWGWCLDDAPVKEKASVSSLLPGVLYSAGHQCRLQYGSGSLLCDDMDNVCSTLWCTVGTTCHSKLDGAVDGTSCGEDKWCFSGECVVAGYRPASVNGGWASWSEWSACSRTCGAGVQSAHRECDNPVPKHRGKYCLGERQRYRICNTASCQQDLPTFRDLQCRHFNTMPYKGRFYKWEAVINRVSPCELHCRPLNEHFSEKMRDAVTDGTPCYEGNKSRDMCINGICKNIGCDYVIGSSVVEDRCGVCNGNGSTCTTVRRTFEESEGLGYVDIGLIPEGAWDIRIEEVAEAGNFLALRSDNPNKYFLNGGWTIQWNGEYKAAGTVFTYERTGHLENLTSPGPTTEPLWIQLLFQETNPGVRYEYTISRNVSEDNDIPSSVFFWKYGSWAECSVTCGTGVQRQIVHCVEKTTGIVEEHLCDPLTRPDDNQTSCHKDPCPAIWWAGEWQKCSSSCGPWGQTKRTVLCIQAVNADEQKALQASECEHVPRPESVSSCNAHIPCPADWTTDSWSKCSLTCGSGVRRRNVTCSRNTGLDCDPQQKPLAVSTCYMQDCPQVVDNFGMDWSGSGWTSKEVLNEIIPDVKAPPKLSTTRAQPRNHKNTIEGDFHYHNKIESIDPPAENSVEVDDFYYDYNFINFHVDLSDDFEGDVTDSGDSHRPSSPQGVKPTHTVTENISLETTSAATTTLATSTNTTTYTVEPEEPGSTNQDAGEAATKEPITEDSDNLDDLLSEDYLLPVYTTSSPPLSTTQHSPTLKEKHGHQRWPESISTVPGVFPGKEQGVKNGEEAENSNKDDNPVTFTATPSLTAPTPSPQTTIDTVVATTVVAQETDNYEYNLNENSTLDPEPDPDVFPGREDVVSSVSPESAPGTVIQVETEVQVDKSRAEIPQTTSQSVIRPTAFTTEPDQTTRLHSQDTDPDLSTTSLPATESSDPVPVPSLLISGNPEASDDPTPSTGTKTVPLANEEGAPMKPVPTEAVLDERTGTDSQPPATPAGFDYNEIIVPLMPSSSSSDPPYQPPTTTAATPQYTTPLQSLESPTSTASVSPTSPATLWTPPALTSVQTSTSTTAYWVTGKWSPCSTSCGLGAIWRTLTCSTGSDRDCDPAKRPAPAQRCYLRPCATWKVDEWTKCSKNCEGGSKSREVQCFDMRDQRPLRPFHCRAMSSRPPSQMPCNLQPCLDWYTSSWGQCSEVCGGGEQQRIVACPEEDRCDRDLQPSNIQSCNSQPCAQWLTGSWGQCSASCGGGVQRRLIKCIDTKPETEEEVDQDQCDHMLQPEGVQKCNLQECESAPAGAVCVRDRLTVRFCQTLLWLGRCHLPNVRAQCCKSCSQRPRSRAAAAGRRK